VTFAGQPRLARLLVGLGAVDAALPFDALGLQHLFVDAAAPEPVRERLAGFGRIVSWFGAHAAPYPERLRGLVDARLLIATPVPDERSPLTVWEHLVATLRPWGASGAADRTPLPPPRKWQDAAASTVSQLGIQRGQPLLVVHPGAGGVAKRWPVEKHARVISDVTGQTACQILVHQGPADQAAAGDLLSALGAQEIPAVTLVEPELDLLAAALAGATAYLGADSGVSHLAATVGASAVILFATETHRRWLPWSATARSVIIAGDERDTAEAAALLRPLLSPRT
jgi:ADP-heptose:LPS heptosyltransferase